MGECFLKKAPAIWAVYGHVIMPVFKANKRVADQQFLARLQVAESFFRGMSQYMRKAGGGVG